MANNVIMFYSDLTNRNLQDLSADLCVYSNTIVNCTVSLTSTLDYSSFAPYDSVECVLINRPNVHSDTEYEYNYYSFMRIGTNLALTNIGVSSTNATAIAAGPLFYISEIADIGGGMRKIKGVSALALLDTQHYGGAYWQSNNKGNVVNEAIDLMQNWHQQYGATNTIYSEELTGTNVNDIVGLLNANTNRNALGQIFVAYGWHVGYNRNVINNATLLISRNPSNFCTYTVPTNRIYVGNNLSEQVHSAGYRVNVTGHNYSSTNGCVNKLVLNNSVKDTNTCFSFNESILPETLQAFIGVVHFFRFAAPITGDGPQRCYSTNIRKQNLWVPIYSFYANNATTLVSYHYLLNTRKIEYNKNVNLNSDKIAGYNMPQFFCNISACEITICNVMDYPFPWSTGIPNENWWEVFSRSEGYSYLSYNAEARISSTAGGTLSNLLVLRANTLNMSVVYMTTSGGGGLSITNYNISDIGIITANNLGQNVQNVLARVSNFASASGTEKLSFPWNGARPGDMLNIASNRNGLITDMTITLSNIPKATANVRISYYGK